MKYIALVLLLALTLLSACAETETTAEPLENVTESTNTTPAVGPVSEPIVIEEVIPQTQSFTVELLTKTKIQYEGVEYEFEIISAGGDNARLVFTTPKETKEVTIKQGEKVRLYKDISVYVSSLSIVTIPTQIVEARITLADWDEDSIHILEDNENLNIDDTSVEIELDDFESGSVDIEIPSLQLEAKLEEAKTTIIGPFTITPITVDGQGKEIVASVEYDDSLGLSYKVTRDETELILDNEKYSVSFTNTFIDTTKSQPIQIEVTVDGKEYELELNEATQLKGAKVTVSDVKTFDDSRDDFVLMKVE